MCTRAEKSFLDGAYELKSEFPMKAYSCFQDSIRAEPEFYDSHFCAAALLLRGGNPSIARARFLKILSEHPTFFGVYVARFMPRFRLMLQIRDDCHVRIRPYAADIAFLVGVLYLREGKLVEAKKSLQTAINADFALEPARIMLAQVLLEQGYYEEGRKLVRNELPNLKSPLDAVAMNILGRCHLGLGDTRLGLQYLDGAASYPFKGCELLRDNLNIDAARELEQKEYLEDALGKLKLVKQGSLPYGKNESAEKAFYRLKSRIVTMRKSGITKSLSMYKPGKRGMERKEKFWELDP